MLPFESIQCPYCGESIDLFVDDVIIHFHFVLFRDELRTERQEAGRHQAADVYFTRFIGRQEISGYLLAHKPVVGDIAVERIDDVIAITPRIGVTMIFIGARGIRITGHVHPTPSPALPITRRIDQAIDYACEPVCRLVGKKIADLLLGGRKSGQIESRASQ